MNNQEKLIIKRALTNMLNSMVKSQDAPCSAEMHLIESVVDLAHLLEISEIESDAELNEEFNYCKEIMNELRGKK